MNKDLGASPDGDRAVVNGAGQAVSAVPASVPNAGGFYQTCKNCAFDPHTCDRRAEVQEGIRGLSLTGVKFRCDWREPFFRVGQRVGVTWTVYQEASEWGECTDEEWSATVVGETKRGFRIAVDDVPSDHETAARDYIKNDSLYCNVISNRLRALDEPDRKVCGYCGSAENTDGSVTGCWASEGFDGFRKVENCLAQAIEARRAETGTGSVHESAVPKGCAQ